METELTGAEVRRLRARNHWSLQYLANRSKVNKAYLSEFENGQRTLPGPTLAALKTALVEQVAGKAAEKAAGKATPRIVSERGHNRLIFVDPHTKREIYRPAAAHLTWTEEDGTSYRMYLGEP